VIQIRWTEQAVQNLEEIKSFIGRDSPSYAQAIVGRLYQAVTQLARFPDSGRVVPGRGVPEIRELVRPPYRIVYRRLPDAVEILLVSARPCPFLTLNASCPW
jgi:plasmid stabilization system protein ParE